MKNKDEKKVSIDVPPDKDAFADVIQQLEHHRKQRDSGGIALDQEATNKRGLYSADWTLGLFDLNSDEYNAVLNAFVPSLNYDRHEFLSLVAFSFSIGSVQEKQRVLNQLVETGLSELQVDELVNTFKEERQEFSMNFDRSEDEIWALYCRTLFSWAQILVGTQRSEYVLCRIVADAVEGKGVIPNVFKRSVNFWTTLADYALVWGVDRSTFDRVVARGLQAAKQKNGETDCDSFSIDLLKIAYATDSLSLHSPRTYVMRRVQLLKQCVLEPLMTAPPKVIYAQAWVHCMATDHSYLGDQEGVIDSLSKARFLLDAAPSDEHENEFLSRTRAEWHAAYLLILATGGQPTDEALDHLRAIKVIHEKYLHSTVIMPILVASLLLIGQGGMASLLLKDALFLKKGNPDTVPTIDANVAGKLLVVGTVSAIDGARLAGSAALKNFFEKELTAPHKKNIRALYVVAKTLSWLGVNVSQEDRDKLKEWVDGHAEIHKEVGAEGQNEKVTYRVTRFLELKIDGQAASAGFVISAIKTYSDGFEAVLRLYALASNPVLRKHCHSLARILNKVMEGSLFGLPINKSMRRFGGFVDHGRTYAGCTESEGALWRGNWVIHDLDEKQSGHSQTVS